MIVDIAVHLRNLCRKLAEENGAKSGTVYPVTSNSHGSSALMAMDIVVIAKDNDRHFPWQLQMHVSISHPRIVESYAMKAQYRVFDLLTKPRSLL